MATRYIIPIVPETLDMITEMNGGIAPEIPEDVQTYFVWNGFLEAGDIISVNPGMEFWEHIGNWTKWTIHAQPE